jgi:hypothetical protein
MGDEPIIIEQFFMGSRGLLWVRLWEVKIVWVRIMGVTLVQVVYLRFLSFQSNMVLYYQFHINFSHRQITDLTELAIASFYLLCRQLSLQKQFKTGVSALVSDSCYLPNNTEGLIIRAAIYFTPILAPDLAGLESPMNISSNLPD